MNLIETVAPISIDNLKKYFIDKSIKYIINYKDSSLQNDKLITYLSNLDIPCDINFEGCSEEQCYDFLKSYLHSTMLVNIHSVETAIIHILGQAREVYPLQDKSFIESNREIIDSWNNKLDSLTLYNMYCVGLENFNEYVESFKQDDTDSLVGVNFVSLIKNERLYDLFIKVDRDNLTYYSKYFNEYMFKGKNLFSFWENDNNPMFLLTVGIAEGFVHAQEYAETFKKDWETLDVASI